ncbi:MAG: hypothetical protein ACM3ML_36855 [Micromonosporaceae bacterium]
MNAKLQNVPQAFNCVQPTGSILTIDRTGHVFPAGGHFQGVQHVSGDPDRMLLTSSSNREAYLVACRMQPSAGRNGVVERVTTLRASPLNHAGGFQADGQLLAIGVEDDSARNRSEVQFWKYPPGGSPSLIRAIVRSGPGDVSTAGAVGFAPHAGGMVLVVGTWDCNTVDVYTSARNPLADPAAAFRLWRTWRKADADKQGWCDNNFGNYQAINLLKQSDGEIFMVGFNRSDGDDWMDLYSLNMSAASPTTRMLRKVAKKHMICHGSCSFDKAAGLQTISTTRFEVYAAKGTSGDHATGTTITLNRFRAD